MLLRILRTSFISLILTVPGACSTLQACKMLKHVLLLNSFQVVFFNIHQGITNEYKQLSVAKANEVQDEWHVEGYVSFHMFCIINGWQKQLKRRRKMNQFTTNKQRIHRFTLISCLFLSLPNTVVCSSALWSGESNFWGSKFNWKILLNLKLLLLFIS